MYRHGPVFMSLSGAKVAALVVLALLPTVVLAEGESAWLAEDISQAKAVVACRGELEEQPVGQRGIRSTISDDRYDGTEAGSVVGGSDLLRALLSLLLVLVLIVGGAYLLRRFRFGKRRLAGGGIEILARSPINAKQSLCLVKFGERLLVVGVSPNHIAALDKVDDPDEMGRITGLIETARPGSIKNTFGSLFRGESRSYEAHGSAPDDGEDIQDPQWNTAQNEVTSLLDKVKGLRRLCFRSPRL